MNLFELVTEVQQATHFGEEEIVRMVRNAWPGHSQFTPTQAALVINSVERQQRRLSDYTVFPGEKAEPKTLTDEQLWGKE